MAGEGSDTAPRERVLCGHCGMPHQASLYSCPYTGRTIANPPRRSASTTSPEGIEVLTGVEVSGKYRIGELIGIGAMGVVYDAWHMHIERSVAIKVLLSRVERAEQGVARFLREARATGQIDHPNVVRLYDVGELPSGAPYLVMERLDGEELAETMARKGPLPEAEAVHIALQVLAGLSEAHDRGVVHRDVKPANIFLTTDSKGQLVPKLVDFSISHLADVERLTLTGEILGTPHYLSPEQAHGDAVDRRADLWAVGVVLYQMLAGRVPFDAPSLAGLLTAILNDPPTPARALRADLHPDLDAIVTVALQKDPGRRFKNARAMASALSQIGVPVTDDQTIEDSHSPFEEEDDPTLVPVVDVSWGAGGGDPRQG